MPVPESQLHLNTAVLRVEAYQEREGAIVAGHGMYLLTIHTCTRSLLSQYEQRYDIILLAGLESYFGHVCGDLSPWGSKRHALIFLDCPIFRMFSQPLGSPKHRAFITVSSQTLLLMSESGVH